MTAQILRKDEPDWLQASIQKAYAQIAAHFPDTAKYLCFANDPESTMRILMDPDIPAPNKAQLRDCLHKINDAQNDGKPFPNFVAEFPSRPKNYLMLEWERREDTITLFHINREKLQENNLFGDAKMMADFLIWRGIAREIQRRIRPEKDIQGAKWVNLGVDPQSEIFYDIFAGMALLMNHGDQALAHLERLSDIRLQLALQADDEDHYTTPGLDIMLDTYTSGVGLASFSVLPHVAMRIINKYAFSYKQRDRVLRAMKRATRTKEGLASPKIDRLLLALDRSLRQSDEARAAFIDKHDLQNVPSNPASDRAIDFLIVYDFASEPGNNAAALAYAYFMKGDGTLRSNRYPDLGAYLKRKTLGISDKFMLMSAAQDPNFIHGLLDSYYAQKAFEMVYAALEQRAATQQSPVPARRNRLG